MQRDYTELLKKLRSLNSGKLDAAFLELHDEEFSKIDCLDCGKCCSGLGPRVSNMDIERLSEYLKIKSSVFVEKYLRIDEDNDYVFKTLPCPFLMEDNFCIVYKSRPKACREYPHTNQKNIKSILNTCVKNINTCPVVENIFIKLEKQRIGGKI
jgi:uncharacterized protein